MKALKLGSLTCIACDTSVRVAGVNVGLVLGVTNQHRHQWDYGGREHKHVRPSRRAGLRHNGVKEGSDAWQADVRHKCASQK